MASARVIWLLTTFVVCVVYLVNSRNFVAQESQQRHEEWREGVFIVSPLPEIWKKPENFDSDTCCFVNVLNEICMLGIAGKDNDLESYSPYHGCSGNFIGWMYIQRCLRDFKSVPSAFIYGSTIGTINNANKSATINLIDVSNWICIHNIIRVNNNNKSSRPNYSPRKRQYLGSRFRYYDNTDATFNIERNPGPEQNKTQHNTNNVKKQANPMRCEHCEKTICRNQKNISCYICFGNFHIKCIGVKDLSTVTDWTCLECSLSVLPFYGCSLEMEDEVNCTQNGHSQDEMSEEALRILQERHNQLKIMHLNTQCMTSTFDELGGGGVGAYIHESMKFKRRKDIEDLQPDLEHLWIEIPGHNKHSKTLIGVMYRSTRILSNSDWLERFESLLGYFTVNWNGLLVLLGDINIDLLQLSNNLTKQY